MERDPRSNGTDLLAAAAVGATAAVAGTRVVARLTRGRFGDTAEYNVAKVSVSGPITRDTGRPSPLSGPGGATADDVVEQIEAADDDEKVEALLVELNTPGGHRTTSRAPGRSLRRPRPSSTPPPGSPRTTNR